jgi:peptidyl-prolyl cis-trans isomerase SurA
MESPMRTRKVAVVAVMLFAAAVSAGAEVIEEIVARVNDDIITMSELDREEQAVVASLYRDFTGAELDRQVRTARDMLLQGLIDRKLLIHRAERLYDMDKMKEVLLDNFMAQQGITDQEELARLLAQDGTTVEDLTRRLLEMTAPMEVIRFEVDGRLAVGDVEVAAYYESHSEEFLVEGEVTFREIVLAAQGDQQAARRAEVEAIRNRLLGEDVDFAEIATEASEAGSAATGGLIGPFTKGDLVDAVEAAVFTLPIGVISPIIETENGLHIIKVESRTEDGMLELEEINDKLRLKIEDDKYSKALEEFLKKARGESKIWVNPKYATRYHVENTG